ncbi:MAG: GntR family transcriptional regulator [Erysipelotrichales bacterium]|nr:GntR family transcriptional regulator [Erysipelotrichales bacterium]
MKVDPNYLLIAKDIALKISKGIYKEGKTLKGRTLLSGEYSVSSETIRKSINILANEKIVSVKHGVGIFVESKSNATKFLAKFADLDEHKKQVSELNELIAQRNLLNDDISKRVAAILKQGSFTTHSEIEFKEIVIHDDCWVINQTIGDVYFYNYTEATIVAIKRGGRTITSPGPDFTFIANDKLIIVGKDDLSYQRAITYLTYGAME